MQPTWLYIKQHNKTGLKYFGKTITDPYTYNGSGVYWNKHLDKHGNDVDTVWVKLFTDQDELTEYALSYSEKHNIVESTEYANLKPEDGLMGGNTTEGMSADRLLERNNKISKALTGKVRTAKHSKNIGKGVKGKMAGEKNPMYGKTHTAETLAKMVGPNSDEWRANLSKGAKQRAAVKIECEHCGKLANDVNYKRWHGHNCKHKVESK